MLGGTQVDENYLTRLAGQVGSIFILYLGAVHILRQPPEGGEGAPEVRQMLTKGGGGHYGLGGHIIRISKVRKRP